MNHNALDLLIHIGYHKTASTWLQQKLFTSASDVFEPFSLTDSGHSTLANYFIYDDEGYVLSPFENNEVRIQKEIENIIRFKPNLYNKIPVISHERLSGNPHASGFDAKKIAFMLRNTFADAHILIVIREQSSFILSNYFQYLSQGGTCSLKRYLNFRYDGKRPFFSPCHVTYLPLISTYYHLYGKDNVTVLPYELFKTKPSVFISTVGKALNADILIDDRLFNQEINKRTFYFAAYYLRSLNNLRKSSSLNNFSSYSNKYTAKASDTFVNMAGAVLPLHLNIKLRRKFRLQVDNWVGNRYAESNKELSKLIGIDLSEYGYC